MKPAAYKDHESLSRAAARWMAAELSRKPSSLFCLATGSTPMRSYEILAQQGANKVRLFKGMRVLKLDEWGGLNMADPASCEIYLRKALIDPLALGRRYVGFRSDAKDLSSEVKRVGSWLNRNGPIDVCVLGLGVNGHLAFNEPAAFLQPGAHVAKLAEASLKHSMLHHSQGHPSCGLTLGIADLLQSRKILLLVSGASKVLPLRRLLTPQISSDFPASFLWLHSDVTLMCDEAAVGIG